MICSGSKVFKLPFTIRWAIPGRVWGRQSTEVKQNIPRR
jgi:hypothetical protein